MSAAGINVVVISGNLTRDPELRHLASGTAVCKLRVAVNTRRKDGQTGEWFDKPNYFDAVVWGGLGENVAKYTAKGRAVTVSGRLEWREWEDQGGNKRQSVEIVADSVQFGPKPAGEQSSKGSTEAQAENNGQTERAAEAPPAEEVKEGAPAGAAVEEEEIPF